MSERTSQIGFSSQRLRLDYLRYVSELALAGQGRGEIQGRLDECLGERLSGKGKANRGSRQKMTTMLLKIWVQPPAGLEGLHQDGLSLLREVPKDDQLAVHWGMTMAVYPFWGLVGEVTGRLFRLQEGASAGQIRRRVQEKAGDREIVARATRCVLRSFVDWGVLEGAPRTGSYTAREPAEITEPRISAWLLEACLSSLGVGKAAMETVARAPALFPFRMETGNPASLPVSPRLEVIRHGLDDEILAMRGKAARPSAPV